MSVRSRAVLPTVLMLGALLGLGLDRLQTTSGLTTAPARPAEVNRTPKLDINEKVAAPNEDVNFWASPGIVLKSHSVTDWDEELKIQQARAATQLRSKVPLSPDELAARRRLERDF